MFDTVYAFLVNVPGFFLGVSFGAALLAVRRKAKQIEADQNGRE